MTEAHLKLANGEQCLKTQTVQAVNMGVVTVLRTHPCPQDRALNTVLNPVCLFPSWPQWCLAKPAEGVDANSFSESTVKKQL